MTREQGLQALTRILCQIDTPDDMKRFLDCMLTRVEIEDVVDRLRIYQELLYSGHSQREAASTLGVSITKITRGAANLHDEATRTYLAAKLDSLRS